MRLKFNVHSNHSKPTRPQGTTPSHPRELKLGARELAAPLTKLYNSCISNGKWPCEWKKGVWSPVFKKDDPLDYRPITVNPLLSPPGGLFLSSTFEEGLNREGGLKEKGGLFD